MAKLVRSSAFGPALNASGCRKAVHQQRVCRHRLEGKTGSAWKTVTHRCDNDVSAERHLPSDRRRARCRVRSSRQLHDTFTSAETALLLNIAETVYRNSTNWRWWSKNDDATEKIVGERWCRVLTELGEGIAEHRSASSCRAPRRICRHPSVDYCGKLER